MSILESCLVAAVATAALTGSAFADDRPRFEPGPVVELDASSVALTRVLLDRQLHDCVASFQEKAPTIQSVTSQGLEPGVTRYVVHGIELVGGDVVTGYVTMSILETRTPATFGFGDVAVYTCRVDSSDLGGDSCSIEQAQRAAEAAAIADFQLITRDTRTPRILRSAFLRTLESFPSQSEFSIALTYPGLIGQSVYSVTVFDDSCTVSGLSAEHLE
jgi:hypothetical protein